jgi:hypothetical protein
MEIYNDWLVSEMTHSEFNELSEEERKERKKLQKQKVNKKYREENQEKVKETNKKYREENQEKVAKVGKKYNQTPNRKKSNMISSWKHSGLHETQEELDRIYELYLNQELCNACDCVLTRNGDRCSTQASMDHDHDTNRFRHIICRSCNTMDNWKKYFC